jgi:glycosyltransferase XagB
MIGLVIAILVGPLAALIRFPMAIGLLLALWFGLADQAALQMAGAGLGVEFVLATLAIMRDRRHRLFLGIVTMPAYHMAQSLPACLAIHTILTRPHYWQKTDHGADARGGRILKSLTGRPQIAG